MIQRLLKKVLPYRIIKIEDEDYIERWFLWGSKGEGENGKGLRLHHILKSDSLRDFHDHPYKFVSLILLGGYREHTLAGVKRFRPGMINRKKAETLHALELDKPAWTLVFTGPRCREWGFQTKDGWVSWRDYHG